MYERFIVISKTTDEKLTLKIFGFDVSQIRPSNTSKEVHINDAKSIYPDENEYSNLNWIPTIIIKNRTELFKEIFK